MSAPPPPSPLEPTPAIPAADPAGALSPGGVDTAAPEAAQAGAGKWRTTLSPADIKHNMLTLIMMDAIFGMGVSDLSVVMGPLWKYLEVSNSVIGLVGSLSFLGLIGLFLSPYISLRMPIKKWYLFVAHIPYIASWGLIGVALILGQRFGWPLETLLTITVVLLGANHFFGGFVSLPHQEYTAACIPMSYRARFTGYSISIGSVLGIISAWIGGLVLIYVAAPASYGVLFLMLWVIAQGGYFLALVGREMRTPVEAAPKAWSAGMLKAFWQDRAFKLVLVNSVLSIVLFVPVYNVFLGQYALKGLSLPDQVAAYLVIVMQGVRILLASTVGHWVDRISPKRAFAPALVFGALSFAPVLLMKNEWGLYLTMGLMTVFMVAQNAITWALIYGIPKPEHRSGHFTIQLIATYATNAVSSIAVGAMCDRLDYALTFLILATGGLLLALFTHVSLKGVSADARDYA